MRRANRIPWLLGFLVTLGTGWHGEARACATCFGAPDSPLTLGLNMGILSLLLVVLFVMSGAVAFFVYLARRAASMGEKTAPESLSQTVGKVH